MSDWYNESGRPLASDTWLEAHHRAKLPERKAFADLIVRRRPRRIVDLGCGPGLWLELLAEALPAECELVGIDSDEAILHKAQERAKCWKQPTKFMSLDFASDPATLPEADVFLAFNIFPYISDIQNLLEHIRLRLYPGGSLIIRQYDGALIRLGPMDDQDRQIIDLSLMASVGGSGQFKHYDLDRVFESIATSCYASKTVDFEIFRRVSPFPSEFHEYFLSTVEWTRRYVSEEAATRLGRWFALRSQGCSSNVPSYVMEIDLVAWLS